MPYPADVFVSYSREDQELWQELRSHLAVLERQELIRTWDQSGLRAGQDRQKEIDRRLASAEIVLLLISPAFLSSDPCHEQGKVALERYRRDRVKVVPVILRPCDWRHTDYAGLQALPAEGKPVTTWPDRDTAFSSVAEGVRGAIGPPKPESWPDGSVLVHVPGGEYTLGTDDLSDEERPVHQVSLSSFLIGVHPVTNEQYGRFLVENPSFPKPRYQKDRLFGDPKQPVVGVTWREARAYCRWAGLELPSEAQWEVAARGEDGRRYPWGDKEPAAGMACFGKGSHPARIGSHPRGKGPYGTLDQAGNVWEWCQDRYDPSAYKGRDSQPDPVVLADEDDDTVLRVARGGSYRRPAKDLHAAYRLKYRAGDWDRVLGFRVARRADS